MLEPEVLAQMDAVRQARDWREYLEALPGSDRVWVIEADAAVAGFARTGPCHDADAPAGAGEVYGLYVDPGRIGTGLGRRLFGHAVHDLMTRHDPILVWHFTGNDRAARFYDRAGFALDGARRPSDFGPLEVRRRRCA